MDWRYLLFLLTFGPAIYMILAWAANGQSGLQTAYAHVVQFGIAYLILVLAIYIVAYKIWTSPRGRKTIVVKKGYT